MEIMTVDGKIIGVATSFAFIGKNKQTPEPTDTTEANKNKHWSQQIHAHTLKRTNTNYGANKINANTEANK